MVEIIWGKKKLRIPLRNSFFFSKIFLFSLFGRKLYNIIKRIWFKLLIKKKKKNKKTRLKIICEEAPKMFKSGAPPVTIKYTREILTKSVVNAARHYIRITTRRSFYYYYYYFYTISDGFPFWKKCFFFSFTVIYYIYINTRCFRYASLSRSVRHPRKPYAQTLRNLSTWYIYKKKTTTLDAYIRDHALLLLFFFFVKIIVQSSSLRGILDVLDILYSNSTR